MTVQATQGVQGNNADYGVKADYNKPVQNEINVFGENKNHKFNNEAFGLFAVAQGNFGCAYGK